MKTQGLNRMITLFFLVTGVVAANGQSESQVPGDNFSLEGALELFKKSASPEEFEKLLNDADSKVNNLDLNGDGYIDYVRVIDRNEGNIHAFILQAVVSETESQDVAVISLEKLADGKAVLQITGDEDVYGVETIIEPTREVRTYAGTTTSRVVVNVWAWPSVRYIYGPYYSSWISPWGWAYRPIWWRPWSPLAYYDYYPYWSPFRPYYSACYTHRVFYGDYYRPYRRTSVIVYNRHHNQINHYRSERRSGRDRYDGDRSRGRISDGSRYDANGRLASNNIQRTNSRTGSDTWTSRTRNEGSTPSRNYQSSTRSTPGVPAGSTPQRSSVGQRSNDYNEKWSGATRSTSPTPQRERTAVRTNNNGISTNSEVRRYSGGSSGSSTNVQRSNSSPNVQRAPSRPSGSSNVQRSSGSSSYQRPSGGSSYQRSSGSSGGQRYSSPSPQRSSGSSGVSRAPSRSSGGSSGSRPGSSGGRRGR